MKQVRTLKMNGAAWLNLSAAEASARRALEVSADRAGLSLNALELNMLAALFEKDGQKASDLARQMGRAATSFTPCIDKLEKKGYVCRAADAGGDRRAINIFLTDLAKEKKAEVLAAFHDSDELTRRAAGVNAEEWEVYQKVIASIQAMSV